MRKLVIAMVALVTFATLVALGCEEKKPDAKPATSAAAATSTAAATAHATATPAKPAGGGW